MTDVLEYDKLTLAERVARLAPEPSADQKTEAHKRHKASAEDRLRCASKNAWPVLAPGTLVRVDIWGWHGQDVCVKQDNGPARVASRKVELKKITGSRAGDTCVVRRDRVTPVPG